MYIQIRSKKDLLTLLLQHLPHNPLIVEAGSFDGTDTVRLSDFWPSGTIYAFEPVAEIFAMLTHNTQSRHNIYRYQYALSDTTGTAPLYLSSKPSDPDAPFQAASLLKPKERLAWSTVTYPKTTIVNTITLDEWANLHAIDHIDFLWLDVQGYALPILQKSPHIVQTTKVLYVEVEFVEAYEGQQQYPEVKSWLESQGFTMIARDFDKTPKWFFGNALFIRKV